MKDNDIRALKVSAVTKIGAFLDWGEPKELFLPFREMTCEIRPEMEILVRKYTDKSGRPAASMKGIYHLLSTASPYRPDDEVTGRIYEFGHDFGTFVAVDDKYSAMLPKHETIPEAEIGDVITARVKFVKEDGKLDITVRKGKAEQMPEDAKVILEMLYEYAGVLPFTEKADPEVIKRECGLSKGAFKRAVGMLYKQKKIEIADNGAIRLVK